MKKLIIIFWTVVAFGLLSIGAVFFLAEKGLLGKMPTIEDLQNPKSDLASEIYSADGKVLGKYFYQNRTNVNYQDLSPHLVHALIATEDERFQSHPGIDAKGTIRAIFYLGKKGGASTITQQLAKMLFTEHRSSNPLLRIPQKIQEWIISAKLERYYTKEEIITMYFNRFDFVNNAVGIKSAAQVYFNTSPDSLRIHQAAMLVGMCKNPSLFNPNKDYRKDTVLLRRNVVLKQMVRNDFITTAEFDSLKLLPLDLNYKSVDHSEGVAPYFREILRGHLKELLAQKDPKTDAYLIAKDNGEPYNIYSDGLRIFTTINSKMQQHAEWAVKQYLSEHLQPLFSKELAKRSNFPFARLSNEEVASVMNTARKRTMRYRILTGRECHNCHRRGDYISEEEIDGVDYWVCAAEDCGQMKRMIPEDSIDVVFDTPVAMHVFSWKGEIDTTMSPNDSIRYYKSFLQAGLMSLNPHTGHIRAWVGGIDHKHFEYDHVYLAKRQVGSTFKPFVYALALEAGLSACHMVPNIPYTFKKGEFGLLKDWTPKNDGDEYGYEVTLKYGLANSMNTITAWVMKRFTPQAAVAYARKCGIKSHIEPVPSLALGVADLSLHEMVSAYSTFANKGMRMEPVFLLRIEDNAGTVIYEAQQDIVEVMSEEQAYKMLDIMMGVTEGEMGGPVDPVSGRQRKTGTAMRMHYDLPDRGYDGIPWDVKIAGKTGTTQGNSDGWFMGIVPDLVTGVWVGAEDRSVRFTRTDFGQGANTALPIWCYYMKRVWADPAFQVKVRPFDLPESLKNYNFDCDNSSSNDGLFDGFDVDEGNLFD
jgi:penicillin-binding protein 1A